MGNPPNPLNQNFPQSCKGVANYHCTKWDKWLHNRNLQNRWHHPQTQNPGISYRSDRH